MAANIKDTIRFWEELQQRRVVRSMMVYIAGALALLEGVDMIFPRLGLPSWSENLVLIILGIGLVVVIVVTWLYDITPEGIIRTDSVKDKPKEEDSGVKYLISKNTHVADSEKNAVSYAYELDGDRISTEKRKNRIYNYSSFIVIISVAVLFTFSSANTVPFKKRDWIVITDFENLTNNPVFDKSLYTAFTLTANQSRYVNILPRSRMFETLKRMKKEENAIVDEDTGREIAVREGIDLYIVPSISNVGNKYSISAKIMDAMTGNLLRSEVVSADNEDEILPRLGQLSRRLRRHLGESRYNIASQDKPLKDVTTSSLEALKVYSIGIDHHLAMDFTGARQYYENALNIDTGFTAAKASLGNLLFERFDRKEGSKLLTEAVRSVDNLTERERLGILTFYEVNVEKDLQKGIEYAKMRIELYPDDAAARNNLGWYFTNSGRYEDALKEYKAAVKISPDLVISYGGICWIFLQYICDIDSAFSWSEKMISDNPDNAWGYFYLGSSYIGFDSLQKAEASFRKGYELNPDLAINAYRLAHTYRLQGKYENAIGILKKLYAGNNDETSALYDLGINLSASGNNKEAAKYFNMFKEIASSQWLKDYPDLPDTYISLGAVSARLGEITESEKMLRKAISLDSSNHQKFAELLSVQGHTDEAAHEIEKALKQGYRDLVWLRINPEYQSLQNNSRFKSLLQKYFTN